ncbi:hypothetical protein BV25DRAFT_633247 [Artomyces pyxidatus]|uniref:Uncharacterized protein n=1 Tax=Artomyces pyxidatus TaxID=48021 RepID=A0ACB8T1W9_9AGAM|nr:hypothetical protein BV25DRAFT_633247 [Artomyces pyxidatus]
MPSSQLSFRSDTEYDSDFTISASSSSSDRASSPILPAMSAFASHFAVPPPSSIDGVTAFSPTTVSSDHLDTYTKMPGKHDRFYFEDGNVTFLVEDSVLYHVHRYLFRDSGLLKGGAQGHSSSPITLKDVRSYEFDAFLSILYPLSYLTCELSTVDEWTAVLRLATDWGYTSIRDLAVARLAPIASAVDRVIFAHTYPFLAAWAVPGYAELCSRAAPLTVAEGRRLGVDDVLLVCTMRESTRVSALLFSEDEIAVRIEDHLRPARPPTPPPPPVVKISKADSWASRSSPSFGSLFSPLELETRRLDNRTAGSTLPIAAGGAALAPQQPERDPWRVGGKGTWSSEVWGNAKLSAILRAKATADAKPQRSASASAFGFGFDL